jgi:hypothetical protein
MGLDITAYKKIKRIGERDADYDYTANQTVLCVNPNFPEQADGFTDGVYEYEGTAFNFRAGGYGWYNDWRAELAKMVGTTDDALWKKPDPTVPFVELINFADNEGIIGPATSKKLYADFKKNHEKAKAWKSDIDDGQPWFLIKYRLWMRAFKLASNGGCVEFH